MLYLVSTPIGNLGDISYRAIEILQTVDLIASEDTRKTSILLRHYSISKPQISFHAMNEAKIVPKLIEKLKAGDDIALVTNAGTPAISDPGYSIVHAALEAGIETTAIPGASAVIMALTLSDLPIHSFTFKGFSPHKEGPRKRFLELEKFSPHTLVFYESPYRLIEFLKNACTIYGNRRIVIANDLTKKFEHIYRGTIEDLIIELENSPLLGEYCVCIEGFKELKLKKKEDLSF